MYVRVIAFFTSVQEFFVSNSQLKKFELIQKSYVPRASFPFVFAELTERGKIDLCATSKMVTSSMRRGY